jgi:hypothetical protein
MNGVDSAGRPAVCSGRRKGDSWNRAPVVSEFPPTTAAGFRVCRTTAILVDAFFGDDLGYLTVEITLFCLYAALQRGRECEVTFTAHIGVSADDHSVLPKAAFIQHDSYRGEQ